MRSVSVSVWPLKVEHRMTIVQVNQNFTSHLIGFHIGVKVAGLQKN